jgi:hypothetical protein
MVIRFNAQLNDLDDVDITSDPPVESDVLTYDKERLTWIPKAPSTLPSDGGHPSNSYVIEHSRWNINAEGQEPEAATEGINNALRWAKSQGYHHVVLPKGSYKLVIDASTFSCITVPSSMHFEMAEGCILELSANSSPWYRIIDLSSAKHSKVSGGTLIGDKESHQYELGVSFVRGGVNSDGSLNDNSNFIRSNIIDRYEHPGLLKTFRLWDIPNVNASGYSFFQYKDSVSSEALAGIRTNGQFAPDAPTGRGWFNSIEAANKMIFTIDISSSSLTDEQLAQIEAKVDSPNYTHEWGHGIELSGSNNIEIRDVEIRNCTGDGIFIGWLTYKINPEEYTQEEMGSNLFIHGCNIHHCRRQGISIAGSNDVYIYHNQIHHIGRADDGETVDGISPMFGIDIESMWSESNIPTWRPELNQKGLELNTRIHIFANHIFTNERGHFVNADGINVVVEGNSFEGYNVGGISSYQSNWYVKYLNNTFIGCELVVKGNNFVNGAICRRGNVRLQDIRGAVIENCHITDGQFYGSSVYGYFGTPSVDATEGRFTFSQPHGMGNGAKISFEQWIGKVPEGISVDKLYYTTNMTGDSFQVSESPDGVPIKIKDAGEKGFNVSRFDYGRCYISNIVIERDWRNDNASSPNFQVILTGGVVKNVTVKNYDLNIRPPSNYAGRPITIQGLTVIEGAAGLEGCHITDSHFLRAKSSRMGGDISLGSNNAAYQRRITAEHCLFDNVGVNFDGSVLSHNNTFVDCLLGKADNQSQSIISLGYLENTHMAFRWLTTKKSITLVRCIFRNVTKEANESTVFVDNIEI